MIKRATGLFLATISPVGASCLATQYWHGGGGVSAPGSTTMPVYFAAACIVPLRVLKVSHQEECPGQFKMYLFVSGNKSPWYFQEYNLTMYLSKAPKSSSSSRHCFGGFWGLSDQNLKGRGPCLNLRLSFSDSCSPGGSVGHGCGILSLKLIFLKIMYVQLTYKLMGFCKVS